MMRKGNRTSDMEPACINITKNDWVEGADAWWDKYNFYFIRENKEKFVFNRCIYINRSSCELEKIMETLTLV